MILLNNVSKRYGRQSILSSISLTIEPGKTYGLIGTNGSGKTTLMRCICGLTRPTSGEVYIDNKIVGVDIDFPDNVGIIIESPGFLPNYTALENLRILAKISGKASEDRVRASIQLMGLDPNCKKPVGKYSLGMRARLGIAQAIMENPDYLILDEPFNGLDQDGISTVHSLLSDLKREGKGILLASHNETDIAKACDHVYHIIDGQITSNR